MTKLTEKQIKIIYLDDRSYTEIANDFYVAVSTVSRIKSGKTGVEITKELTPVLRRPGRIPNPVSE